MVKTIEIRWENKDVSLNKWYAGIHWTKRKKMVDEWHSMFKELLDKYNLDVYDKYEIDMLYNSRLDPSNTITVIKLLEDCMVKEGYILGDSKKYCLGLSIRPVLTMGKKEYIASIKLYK